MNRSRLFVGLVVAVALARCSAAPSTSPAPPQAVPPAPPAAAPHDSSFIAGIVVVREDVTTLEPIARFDGTRWINSWPAPADTSTGPPPPALDAIPEAWLGRRVPGEWFLHTQAGETRRARTIGTRHGDACESILQLTLERLAPAGATTSTPIAAVDADRAVGSIRTVITADADWPQIQPLVLKTFRENEASARTGDPRLSEQVKPEALAHRDITIEYLVRPGAGTGPFAYYFEATRRIEAGTAQERAGIGVSGWLLPDGRGGWTTADLSARFVGTGDANPVPARAPLATFDIGGRVFWLVELRGYEGSGAAIVEVTPAGATTVITVGRSGC